MRRLARPTASQSQTLRLLRPTKVHSSSSSSTSQSFFGRRRGSRGAIAQRFFYPLGNAHARNAGHALDAALRIALAQQLVDLCVLRGLGHGNGYKTRLVAAGFALVAGMALAVPVPLNLVTAAFGAEVLRINHKAYYGFHPDLDYHRTIDGGSLNQDEN